MTSYEKWRCAHKHLTPQEQKEMGQIAAILTELGGKEEPLTEVIYHRWNRLGRIAIDRYDGHENTVGP